MFSGVSFNCTNIFILKLIKTLFSVFFLLFIEKLYICINLLYKIHSNIMLAIKGTDANMQCHGGFQYELNKTYKMNETPILCEQGFHACLNPYWVECFYEDNGKNRYFLVELGGTIIDCDDSDTKVASNEITFLKKVTVDDFPALFEEFIQDKERLSKLKYYDGFAVVRKGDEYNYVDKDGKLISEDWFDYVDYFSDGFASVKKDGIWYRLYPDGHLERK